MRCVKAKKTSCCVSCKQSMAKLTGPLPPSMSPGPLTYLLRRTLSLILSAQPNPPLSSSSYPSRCPSLSPHHRRRPELFILSAAAAALTLFTQLVPPFALNPLSCRRHHHPSLRFAGAVASTSIWVRSTGGGIDEASIYVASRRIQAKSVDDGNGSMWRPPYGDAFLHQATSHCDRWWPPT